MVIVLEGIRKSGKTTFADALTKWGRECDVPVFRFYDRELQTYPVNQMEANFVSCMQFARAAFEVDYKLQQLRREPIVLFDRFHISELIFGHYYRQYDNDKFMNQVDTLLASHDASLVLFESGTSDKRAKPGELLFKHDFWTLYRKSKIERKLYMNLDGRGGKLEKADIEEALERLGF